MGRTSFTRERAVWILLFFTLVLSNRIAFPNEEENFKSKFSINLKGGLSYLPDGDINRHLKTYDTYLSEMTDNERNEIKIVNYFSNLEGELRWDISSKYALSIGIGYIYGENENYFEFQGPFPFQSIFDSSQNYIIKSGVKTIPLKLGIYYTVPLRSRINLFFDTGIGYYISKSSLYKQHWSSSYGGYLIIYTKEERYNLTANTFGFHAGAGFEFDIANNLALLLEIQGRYARINLKGNKTSSVWEALWVEEEGNLYIGERNLADEGYGEHCPDLIISRFWPSGDEFQNIRKAVLDLSGFSLRVGIRIKLF